jgi:hypothetical protein
MRGSGLLSTGRFVDNDARDAGFGRTRHRDKPVPMLDDLR